MIRGMGISEYGREVLFVVAVNGYDIISDKISRCSFSLMTMMSVRATLFWYGVNRQVQNVFVYRKISDDF